ncbi:NAD(P)/FAD-dependent oxidoreductase [Nocardia veterana]|uniref:NAD(P)/FAD-dependent oxidoreductase n=1 Tax=Nocardia veterana TaxID=132249 RepID=A0A7X6M372_9NOCA|nr:NAD(P)/FAD-dependent oxidoreductase [Nocardia veterana]NKY89342.1 NAD(P)/FAD-dependent oxidoreductase [Nocardia veterana]
MSDDYDVIVAGGSLAGCAVAILLGRRGLRVAVLESHRDPAFYKRACTHLIQPTALPTVRRLGLDTAIEAAGGVRMYTSMWTPAGWANERGAGHPDRHGYTVRRSVLDPLIRKIAAATPGVELVLGAKVVGLHRDGNGRIGGVVARIDDAETTVRARLVVGADGASSRVAPEAGLRAVSSPNRRSCYFAYFRNVPVEEGNFRVWLRPPDALGLIGADDGLTLISMLLDAPHVREFLADKENYLRRRFADVPDPPDLSAAVRVSEFIGARDKPNLTRRRIVRPGLALVGDAALVADPLRGVGCGWALEGAEWLADATADALTVGDTDGLDAALRRYQRQHRRALWPQQFLFNRNARLAIPPWGFRKVISTMASDPQVAELFWPVVQRAAPASSILTPHVLTALRRSSGANRDAWYHPRTAGSGATGELPRRAEQ